jgi:hypothetical protein
MFKQPLPPAYGKVVLYALYLSLHIGFIVALDTILSSPNSMQCLLILLILCVPAAFFKLKPPPPSPDKPDDPAAPAK